LGKDPLKFSEEKAISDAGVGQLVKQGFCNTKSETDEKSSENQSVDEKKDKKGI
jgi:hypothetical protein